MQFRFDRKTLSGFRLQLPSRRVRTGFDSSRRWRQRDWEFCNCIRRLRRRSERGRDRHRPGCGLFRFRTKFRCGRQAATSQGNYSIAIGGQNTDAYVTANGTYAIAIGVASTAPGINSIAVGGYAGYNPGANNDYSTALGAGAGRDSKSQGYTAIGLASGQQVTGDLNTAIANSAGQTVTGTRNLAIGVSTGQNVDGSYNAAFGDQAGSNVTGSSNIAIGPSAGRNVTASHTIAIGKLAEASAGYGMAIGTNASVTASDAVAIGHLSEATGVNTVSVGRAKHERRIVNVADATGNTDAVNLRQVKSLIAAAKAGKPFPDSVGDPGPISSSTFGGVISAGNEPRRSTAASSTEDKKDKPRCGGGDIAGAWSLIATNIEQAGAGSVLWCDAQFNLDGSGTYSVTGRCRSHEPRDSTPQDYDLTTTRPVAVTATCQMSGRLALRHGETSLDTTILEGRIEANGEIKSRAVGVSRLTLGSKVALQTFVMQR